MYVVCVCVVCVCVVCVTHIDSVFHCPLNSNVPASSITFVLFYQFFIPSPPSLPLPSPISSLPLPSPPSLPPSLPPGHLVHHVKMGKEVKKHVEAFPALGLEASIQPITRTVLRIRLVITPEFKWNSRYHGNTGEGWWIWVEDPENDHLYHSEYFLLLKKHVSERVCGTVECCCDNSQLTHVQYICTCLP